MISQIYANFCMGFRYDFRLHKDRLLEVIYHRKEVIKPKDHAIHAYFNKFDRNVLYVYQMFRYRKECIAASQNIIIPNCLR